VLAQRFIGITGGTCSGKTTLEDNLAAIFGDEICLFPFDDMFAGLQALQGRKVTNWEAPGLYRWNDLIQHLHDLKNGRPTTIDARSRDSAPAGILTRRIEPRPSTVVAGFLTLYHPAVRDLFDSTIYLHAPEEVLVARRLARANPRNPWDEPHYIHQMLMPGHRRVVLPQRDFAQHIIDATMPPADVAQQVTRIIRDIHPRAGL
jgi:uridine kinase